MEYFMLALPVCVDFFQPLTLHIQYLSPLWQWPSQSSQREHWPQEWLEELGTARCPEQWLLGTLKTRLVDPHHASRMMFHKQGLAEASELGCLLTGPVPRLIDNGLQCQMGLPETDNLSLTIFPRVRSSLSIEINTNSVQPPCSRPVVL